MAVSEDRKYTKLYVYNLLEGIKGKTLGEVDSSCQFARTESSKKITGIAGDVIEQSVFKYARDSKQECDIEIDGVLTELKTTGVRIPKCDLAKAKGKTGQKYNKYLGAKEGISITGVTFEPDIQTDFQTSHFWEKAERMLIVFYEYKSYEVVPASAYANFPIIDYCYNIFSDVEKGQLQNDWEIVRDYLQAIYNSCGDKAERNERLQGFTHKLRPKLLLIELVPGFKKKSNGNYQRPRYRLKQTFVDSIVRGHFGNSRTEVQLKEAFTSFSQLDARCHELTLKYGGKTFVQLKEELGVEADITAKNFGAQCILKMFDVKCKKLNQISDFAKTGIIAKTVTITPEGARTEDMKLSHIDFEEWADYDMDFEESAIYSYFCEHSFLCPVFCERGNTERAKLGNEFLQKIENERVVTEIGKTTFEGFKRFSFDDEFIGKEVKRTWEDSRTLIHQHKLKWEYLLDRKGNRRMNKSGSYQGAPNFPKSSEYEVFFRGGSADSSVKARTECVNGIKMLPQFFWLKGTFIAEKLKTISYL